VEGARVRRLDEWVFYLQGSRWVDSRLTASGAAGTGAARKVRYLSDEYFRLLDEEPGIGKVLSMGAEVSFLWKGRSIEIGL